MPKVFISNEERENQRFCDFVRGELRRQHKTLESLGNELCLDKSGVSQRINGKTRWTLTEAIITLSYLDKEFTLGGRNGRQRNSRHDPDISGSMFYPADGYGEYKATYTG